MHRSIGFIRTYATKSKTTNLKYKPSVPVQQTTLADGSVFIERQPVVSAARQATAAPLLRQPKQFETLGEKEINEIRQLRESDAATWTRSKLAKKFGCSELYIGIVAPLKNASQTEKTVEHGYRKQLIKENRQKRKALW
ncbi:mitochondrial ribosomal protein subunit L20-domain-containing protein [Sporodiniella umbellata]|nr:mitochondrial ribosomal protein subunit L20-domain-containing protein [Sporodiniella umbellata]